MPPLTRPSRMPSGPVAAFSTSGGLGKPMKNLLDKINMIFIFLRLSNLHKCVEGHNSVTYLFSKLSSFKQQLFLSNFSGLLRMYEH